MEELLTKSPGEQLELFLIARNWAINIYLPSWAGISWLVPKILAQKQKEIFLLKSYSISLQ